MSKEYLLLKWGTVKGWDNLSESSFELMKEYHKEGVPMSAMMDRPDVERIEVLCKLIDQLDGTIQNDWTGEMMTKEEAKEYLRDYAK